MLWPQINTKERAGKYKRNSSRRCSAQTNGYIFMTLKEPHGMPNINARVS